MVELKNILSDFAEKKILKETSSFLKTSRKKALEEFNKIAFFNSNSANLQNSKLNKFLDNDYSVECSSDSDISTFSCELNYMDSAEYYLINSDKLISKGTNSQVTVKNILEVDDDILSKFFNKIAQNNADGFSAINTAAFTGGFFIQVPDNTNIEIPIQLIALNNCDENYFSNTRNLIIVGKNSNVKIIQCDDTIHNRDYFLNTLTEVYAAENSHIELYKMYNISNASASINSIIINQEANSLVKSFSFELNAGLLQNNIVTNLKGEGAQSLSYGVYLTDKQQQTDNNLKIIHSAPHCLSEQVFKGIVDDTAHAVFNGLIVVDEIAQKTEASQVNRNILLTDKARATSKPFLEIYADDVKCSHGATVGQLDDNALFYLQARGISFEKARMLLLHAFVGEIISKIKIDAIAVRISDLVKKRLNGELSDCKSCVLKCSDAQTNNTCKN